MLFLLVDPQVFLVNYVGFNINITPYKY